MAVLSGLHRRIQQTALGQEALVMGMRLVGPSRRTRDEETPIDRLHTEGAVVRCSFTGEGPRNAPDCPYEDRCEGIQECHLLAEA
jgi:hypothetical protein